MWILLLGLTFGLVASSWANSDQDVKMRSCSYRGVFQIQGNDRYTLNYEEAQDLCTNLGTTLASNEQVTTAHQEGLESCRYGWVSGRNVTISRHVPNAVCAMNMTGVITLAPPHSESHYDAYCYDKTDLSRKNCTFEIKNVGNNPEIPGSSENTDSQDFNNSEIPPSFSVTAVSEELHTASTITPLTDFTHTINQTNPTSTSSHSESDASGNVLDQNTQSPSTTTEATTEDDTLSTESPEHVEEELKGNTKKYTTIITALDTTGSGMGETTLTTTSEGDPADSKDTPEDHSQDSEEYSVHDTATTKDPQLVNSENSGHSRGRMGHDLVLPPEENSSSRETTDWLIILVVVVAIAAIILVAALVVTRNRWCGRSQTLMITSKSSSEGNGAAASVASPQEQEREQEMVTLMNKEKIQENGNTEEFTVITLEESPEKNQQA